MLKAKVTFTKHGVTVKQGQEIKPGTFDADVLFQSLLDEGLVEYTPEPKAKPAAEAEGSKKK